MQEDPRPQDDVGSDRHRPGPLDGSDLMPLFVMSGPGRTRPYQASPHSGTGRSSRLRVVPEESAVRRYRLSSCLPSCLKAEDTS
ncbi:insulin receptor substrate 2-B-like isoform X1 [Lates japonicus]|uniref:Insulin receptor substrate 2-B-like isoform X1 n=1 Tax=Lates japonicus TaxID=270547 RepID=A0AAD3RCH8_LATJO|nr:insulin receptor substrate 2-B-like isoform X1 [Lates japonicus]